MASHDQFDAAPSVASDVVPVVAPHAAHRVSRGVPRHRAHHATHVPAPGVALGGGGPSVAPIPGHAAPAAPARGPAAPPPCIDIDVVFAFSE